MRSEGRDTMDIYHKLRAQAMTVGRAGEEEYDSWVLESLRGLAGDPRFAALVASIEDLKEFTAEVMSQPKYANVHGTLEHGAGARDGLNMLRDRLRAAMEMPRQDKGRKGRK